MSLTGRHRAEHYVEPELSDDIIAFYQRVVDDHESGYLIFVVRRAYVLFMALVDAGLVTRVDLRSVYSSRALDGSLRFLADDPHVAVTLVDDCVRSGLSIQRLIDRIRARAEHTRIHVRTYASLPTTELDRPGVTFSALHELDAAAFDALSVELARFIAASGRPYFVDFPLTEWSVLSRDTYYDLMNRSDWIVRPVTNAVHTQSGQEQLVFSVGGAQVEATVRRALGPFFDHMDICKVRCYARFSGPRVYVRILPIVTLKALRIGDVDRVVNELLGVDPAARGPFHNVEIRAKFRLAQFLASLRLMAVFRENLPSDTAHQIRFQLDRDELRHHLPPGIYGFEGGLDGIARFELGPVTRTEPLELLTPTRIVNFKANTPELQRELSKNGLEKLAPQRAARSVVRRAIPKLEDCDWASLGGSVFFDADPDREEPRARRIGLRYTDLHDALLGATKQRANDRQLIGEAIDVFNDIGAVVPSTCYSPVIGEVDSDRRWPNFVPRDAGDPPPDWCIYRGYRAGEDLVAIRPEQSATKQLDALITKNRFNSMAAAFAGLVDPVVDEIVGLDPKDDLKGGRVAYEGEVEQGLLDLLGIEKGKPRYYGWPRGIAIPGYVEALQSAEIPRKLAKLSPAQTSDLVKAAALGSMNGSADRGLELASLLRGISTAVPEVHRTGGSADQVAGIMTESETGLRRSIDDMFEEIDDHDRRIHTYWQAVNYSHGDVVKETTLAPSATPQTTAWNVPDDCVSYRIETAARLWGVSQDEFRGLLAADEGFVSVMTLDRLEIVPMVQLHALVGEPARAILRMFRLNLASEDGLRWLYSYSTALRGRPVDLLKKDAPSVLDEAKSVVAHRSV